ncbi:MAG: LptA/OstA family protein [Syntrophobacteraceae bacterium]|nr:LptA/OstA family protein [Syntrophobacteraceae bacterium]
MCRFITLRLFAILLVALVFCPPVLSEPVRAAKSPPSQGPVTDFGPKIDNKAPIKITSDRMETHQQARTVIFEGHVNVRQNDLTITSKLLTVILAQEHKDLKSKPQSNSKPQVKSKPQPKSKPEGSPTADSDPQQRIDYIDFKGDVRVTQQDRVATSQEAIFFQKDQKILLEGSPVVTKGKDRIEGRLITIYLKDNRCVVEGGGGSQVHAVLFPEKKE